MKRLVIPLFFLLTATCFMSFGQDNAAGPSYSFGVKISGQGRPMILIPGFKGAGETFDDVVAHYKEHYTCYVITLAGFAGQPPSGVKDNLLKKQSDDIAAYVIDKKLKQPVLVGFSFGGTLALWMAAMHPKLFGPIIDIDGVPFESAIENPFINIDSLRKVKTAAIQRFNSRSVAYLAKRDSVYHTPASHKEGFKELYNLESDSVRRDQILRWDEVSDARSGVLMTLEMDTLDLRKPIRVIHSPILVLGSWKGWDSFKTKDDAEKAYTAQFANARKVTVAFSAEGKHFLMYDDLQWMLSEMDKFLTQK
jgi:N-formylmaleamate deformylase